MMILWLHLEEDPITVQVLSSSEADNSHLLTVYTIRFVGV